jgi:hypothetical protein
MGATSRWFFRQDSLLSHRDFQRIDTAAAHKAELIPQDITSHP